MIFQPYSASDIPEEDQGTTPDIETNQDDVTTIKCLTFLIQRSNPQELIATIKSLASIPLSSPQLNPSESTTRSFVNIALDLIAGPQSEADLQPDASDWKCNGIKGPPLINLLHFLIVRCQWPGDAVMYHEAMESIWDIFAKTPSDMHLASQVTDIMEKPFYTYPDADINLIIAQLDSPSNPIRDMVYSRLLAQVMSYKPFGSWQQPGFPQQRLVDILTPTMWNEDEPNLEHLATGHFCIDLLCHQAPSDSDEFSLSEYLDAWVRWATTRTDSDRSLPAYPSAISTLLELHPDTDFWPEKLENDGHAALLLEIFSKFRGLNTPNFGFSALAAFLQLWDRRRRSGSSESGFHYSKRSTVQAVVAMWSRVQEDSYVPLGLPSILQLLPYYLEAASRSGELGGVNLAYATEMFKTLGDKHLVEPAKTQLYDIMDSLASKSEPLAEDS